MIPVALDIWIIPHAHTHTHRCVFNVWIFIQPNRLNLVKSHKCATWTWLNGEQAVIYISWLLYIYKYTWMDWQPQTHGIIIFPNGNWGVQYFWVKNTWENEGLKAVRTADRFIQTASERTRQFFFVSEFTWPDVTCWFNTCSLWKLFYLFLYSSRNIWLRISVGEAESRANAFTSWNWTLFVMLA